MSDIAAARFKRKVKAGDCTAEEAIAAALEAVRSGDLADPLRAVVIVKSGDFLDYWLAAGADDDAAVGMLERAKHMMFEGE